MSLCDFRIALWRRILPAYLTKPAMDRLSAGFDKFLVTGEAPGFCRASIEFRSQIELANDLVFAFYFCRGAVPPFVR